jgi:hypothetical protein
MTKFEREVQRDLIDKSGVAANGGTNEIREVNLCRCYPIDLRLRRVDIAIRRERNVAQHRRNERTSERTRERTNEITSTDKISVQLATCNRDECEFSSDEKISISYAQRAYSPELAHQTQQCNMDIADQTIGPC